MNTTALPELTVSLNDSQSSFDIIDAFALRIYATGTQPWSRYRQLTRVRSDAQIAAEGGQLVLEARGHHRLSSLMTGEGWTLWVVRWDQRSANITVFAESDERAKAVMDEATADTQEAPAPEESRVEIGFWHNARSATRRSRKISCQPWSEVANNYNASVSQALERLVRQDSDRVSGKMILFHGPPGTGKTSALRTLAWEWRSWCQFDYVLDPEALLTIPGYLVQVITESDDDDDDNSAEGTPAKWRLLLLEDCDELIRADAKSGTGQALSRLLNLTDGLLGQGAKLIVAISTNEPLSRLHPAVIRPGRCLAQVEVGPLSAAEANRWMGRPVTFPNGSATLAELYARRGSLEVIEQEEAPVTVGQYL